MKYVKSMSFRRHLGLAFAFIFLFSCLATPSYASYDSGDSGIVPAGHSKDVFLNIDSTTLEQLAASAGKTLSADDIKKDLMDYLIVNGNGLYNEATLRIRSNITKIDTTDLSDWYVYDHYDTGYGVTSGAVAPYVSSDTYFTELRPYYGCQETQSGGYAAVTTIEYLMNNPSALTGLQPDPLDSLKSSLAGYSLSNTSTKFANVRKLREHIYSYSDAGGSHMTFMGYGGNFSNVARNFVTDFLFYPAKSKDTKVIEFNIVSSDVRTHSMSGAGFLINTGIKKVDSNPANNLIYGYVLYIAFSPINSNGPPSDATITLYRIKDGTKVNDLHDRLGNGITTANRANVSMLDFLESPVTVSNNTALFGTGASFKNNLHLKIEFDDNGISVWASDTKDSPATKAVFNTAFTTGSLETGYYGFGPMVDYTAKDGHNCTTTSVYKFINLEMAFKSDVLDSLLNTQFYCAQNVDRFYVNLIGEEVDETNQSFWDAVSRLRSDKIYYVTNADNTVVGDNGANLNNGLKLSSSDYNNLIAELGDYILKTLLANWDENNLLPSGLNRPAASFDLLGSDIIVENEVVDRIEKQMLALNPITFLFLDKSEYNNGIITHLEVKWYDPDGNEIPGSSEIIPYAGKDIYDLQYTVDSTSPPGIYTVEIVAVGNDGVTGNATRSIPVRRSFELVMDTLPPTCGLGANSTANMDAGLYKATSVWLDLSDHLLGWGAGAYRIGFAPDGETLARIDNKDDSIKWITTSTTDSDGLVYLNGLWLDPPYKFNIPDLKQEGEFLYVQVWDWVGNTTLYKLPIAPYSVTVSKDNAFDIDLSAFTIPSGPDADYGTLYQYNATVATPPVNAEEAGNGKYKLIGFNTDKYADTGLQDVTVTGDMVLYPVFEYIGDNIDITLGYNNSKPVLEIIIDIAIQDDQGNPVNVGDGSGYFILEYDENDTIPNGFSEIEMEELASSGGGWHQLSQGSSEINIPSGELSSGKKYVVLIKITDENGNVSYDKTGTIECFIPSGVSPGGSGSGTDSTDFAYKINAAAGTGGKISDAGSATVSSGASKTYTITPDYGKRILDVLVDGVSVGGTDSYTITDINKNVTINAVFTDIGNFIINAKIDGNGSINSPGRTAHEPGTSAVYAFAPGAGYILSDVLVNGVSIGVCGNYTFENIGADMEIMPVFVPLIGLNTKDHFAYIIGCPDGLVHPGYNITREETVTIFFRLLSDEYREANLSYNNNFNDVSGDRWSNCAISTLASAGIVKGKTITSFDPSGNITRAEFATIAARFINVRYRGVNLFKDISGHWAEYEINIAAINGWIIGENGFFRPNDNITRAEAMTLINRVLGRTPEYPYDLLDDMIKWIDNSDLKKWYYLPVQEATNSHDYIFKEDGKHERWTAKNEIPDWIKRER